MDSLDDLDGTIHYHSGGVTSSRVIIRPLPQQQNKLVTRKIILLVGVLVVVTLATILVSLCVHWWFSVLENGHPRLKYNTDKMSSLQVSLLGKLTNLMGLANRSVHEPVARETLRNFSRQDRSTCYSALCVHTGLTILDSMDWKEDPCEDFYAFTCGGWVAKNPPEQESSVSDHFAKINDRVILATQKIMSSQSERESDDPAKKGLHYAKNFYQDCSNVEGLNSAGVTPIMEILEEYGGWPILYGYSSSDTWSSRWSFSWLSVVALLQRLQISAIISLEIKQDQARAEEHALYVVEPLFFISREYLVSPQRNVRLLTAYKKFVVEVALELISWRKQNFNLTVDMTRLDDMADQLVAFEVNLAKIVTPETTVTSVETFYQISKLQQETDKNWTNSQPLNALDWNELLKGVFNGSGMGVKNSEKILVHDIPYLQHLVKLLDSTPTETLANYLLWRLMAKFTTGSTINLRKIHASFYKDLYGEQKLLDRNATCSMVVNSKFAIAVGSEFVRNSFESGLKREVETLAASVKLRMTELLKDQKFIPPLLQMAIVRKLGNIKICVGYPQSFSNDEYVTKFYEDLELTRESYIGRYIEVTTWLFWKSLKVLREPFDKDCWGGNYWSFIGEAYAYYDTARNSINLPVGLLQNPFYYKRPNVPMYMNYGGIGTIIGHELTHSLNIEGWIRIKLVPQLESLWECLISSYSETDIPELEGKSKVDGFRTRSENFADHFGLASAFYAYQQHLKGTRGSSAAGGEHEEEKEEMKLPGFELFTGSQMFFISFANVIFLKMWCDAKSKESLYDEVESSTHTPSKYRVLGALRNSKDFSQTWNCPVGSKMSPRRKCNLF